MREPNFGWSYPPGCSGPPEEEECHPIIDELYEILGEAGVDDKVVDTVIVKVLDLIDDYEKRLWKYQMKSIPEESIFDE